MSPGHVFPLQAQDGGVLQRAGHTEASVALAKMAGLFPAGVICEILNEDGTMARLPDLDAFRKLHHLKMCTIRDLIEYRRAREKLVVREQEVAMPTKFGEFKLHLYRSILDGQHHAALVMGTVRDQDNILVRLHSECLTGDVFGSLRCNCGPQLHDALQRIAAEGRRYTRMQSDIRGGVNAFLKVVGLAIVPVGALLVWGGMRTSTGAAERVTDTVAALTAMIPQGLVLLTSIAFAVSAVALARRQVLVQELAAVEGLARVDVLCTGMSLFSVGGNLGFALGPILALSIVSHLGFASLPFMAGLTLLFLTSLLTVWKMLRRSAAARAVERRGGEGALSAVTWPVVILVATVIVRSWIHAGLMTYVPFYYIDYLKGDPVHAGQLVSSFLLGGVAGALLGSPIADKWGHKRYLVTSMLLAALLFPAILAVEGILLGVVLALFGMVLISTFTVTIVMAQRLMPHNLGMASGLMVGFAIGTGGLGVTILGLVADRWGVPFALQSICLLPIAGFILSALLKYPSAAPIVERASSS